MCQVHHPDLMELMPEREACPMLEGYAGEGVVREFTNHRFLPSHLLALSPLSPSKSLFPHGAFCWNYFLLKWNSELIVKPNGWGEFHPAGLCAS